MTPSERKWALLNIVPILFLIVNGIVWYASTPAGFQRFGSIGVMVAAIMFGIDRVSRLRLRRPARTNDDLMLTELSLVGVSTLQWGYGDLFHCWTNGHGWEVCQ